MGAFLHRKYAKCHPRRDDVGGAGGIHGEADSLPEWFSTIIILRMMVPFIGAVAHTICYTKPGISVVKHGM